MKQKLPAENQRILLQLLQQQPVASLATLHENQPSVSMVPFVLQATRTSLIIHVSSLAAHTRDMQGNPAVGMMIMEIVNGQDSPLSLPRVSIQGQATTLRPDSSVYRQARLDYLQRFPESEQLFGFADFSLVQVSVESLRLVAGFGRAYSLSGTELSAILASC